MSANTTLICLIIYFSVLILIAQLTKDKNKDSFFTGNRSSKWYLVAFGMIGSSLSGVTFISVPGWVKNDHFNYLSICAGYVIGYLVIAFILMPLYYKLEVISIYSYLKERFGKFTYKTGATFFLISRLIGSSFRLYLAATVLQLTLFDHFKIPFEVSVFITIALIWLYTFQGGIKTIIWTDTLQTFFMISAAVLSIYFISNSLNLGPSQMFETVVNSPYSELPGFKTFLLGLINGAFITIVMTGLDQDMMQKNLTIKTLKDAQKNMLWFGASLFFVNLIFLTMGVLLYTFADVNHIDLPAKADQMYPFLAFNHFSQILGILFILGITAAAYSSADSALTALTTSFCIDILGQKDITTSKRTLVHIGFSVVTYIAIVIFHAVNNDSVISELFTIAGYTYGPLLGLYTVGIFFKFKIKDQLSPIVCVLSPTLSYALKTAVFFYFDYKFGFELLLINGAITILGLYLIKSETPSYE